MRSMGLRVVLRFPLHSWKRAFLGGCFCVYNKAFVCYQNLMGRTSGNEPAGKRDLKDLRFKIIIIIERLAYERSCLSVFHPQSHGSLVRKRRQTSSILGKRLQTAMSLRGAPPVCTSPLWLCLVQHLQLTFKQLPFFFWDPPRATFSALAAEAHTPIIPTRIFNQRKKNAQRRVEVFYLLDGLLCHLPFTHGARRRKRHGHFCHVGNKSRVFYSNI